MFLLRKLIKCLCHKRSCFFLRGISKRAERAKRLGRGGSEATDGGPRAAAHLRVGASKCYTVKVIPTVNESPGAEPRRSDGCKLVKVVILEL